MDIYSSACGFFFHPLIRPYMFAYTNKEKYDYDSELIDSYKELAKTMGTHIDTSELEKAYEVFLATGDTSLLEKA